MQDHPAKNTPLDMNRWLEIIKAWNKSEETQKDYCHRLGINLNTFSYTRSKLQKQDKSKAQFVPLKIRNNSEEKQVPHAFIILENPQGYKLHLSASLSLEQLVKVFKLSGWHDAQI